MPAIGWPAAPSRWTARRRSSRGRAPSPTTAREEFDEDIEEYATGLRKWLSDYREAADARGRTFELGLAVTSAKRGAYVEDVSLVIELPEGVEIVEEWPTVAVPPEPPAYMPPRPRDPFDIPRPSFAGIGISALAPIVPTVARPHVSL
jgi:hypothetical protein